MFDSHGVLCRNCCSVPIPAFSLVPAGDSRPAAGVFTHTQTRTHSVSQSACVQRERWIIKHQLGSFSPHFKSQRSVNNTDAAPWATSAGLFQLVLLFFLLTWTAGRTLLRRNMCLCHTLGETLSPAGSTLLGFIQFEVRICLWLAEC